MQIFHKPKAVVLSAESIFELNYNIGRNTKQLLLPGCRIIEDYLHWRQRIHDNNIIINIRTTTKNFLTYPQDTEEKIANAEME